MKRTNLKRVLFGIFVANEVGASRRPSLSQERSR